MAGLALFAKTCNIRHMAKRSGVVSTGTPDELDDRLDLVFGALADRSRRAMVRRLATAGELPVGEAATDLELSPAGISKHVKVLEGAGILRRRVEGRRHVLALESEPLLLAEDWIDRYRSTWTTSLARLADLAAELEGADDD
jgi:DNA-binding transcriptional ArsR family regulator